MQNSPTPPRQRQCGYCSNNRVSTNNCDNSGKAKSQDCDKKVEGSSVTILPGTTVVIRISKQVKANATATADSKLTTDKPKAKKQRQEQSATDSIDIRRTTISPPDIPEILTRVGFFLPSYVPNPRGEDFGDGEISPFLDRTRDVLNCMLVSKHWYEVMIPVFWYTCLAARDLYARFVQANPGLKSLSWDGSVANFISILNPTDFAGLDQLQSLTLHWWDGSGGRLASALGVVARTLTGLTLKHVDGYERGVVTAMDSKGPSKGTDDHKDANNGGGSGQGAVARITTLCLPVVSDLVLDTTKRVEWLVGCCPCLECLDIRSHAEDLDTNRIAQGIRETACHQSQILHVSQTLTVREVLPLIQTCPPSSPGLQRLLLDVEGLSADVVSGILAHAPTLKTLDLSIQRCYTSCLSRVLQLLGGCPERLESLSLTIYKNYGNDLVAALGSRTWGCRRLKELYLMLGSNRGDVRGPLGQGPGGHDAELQALEEEEEDKEEEDRDIKALRP